MADFTVSRLGAILDQKANYEQERAMFLLKFSGEVLTSYEETNVFGDKHYTRTISEGKSAQFPVIGRSDAHYHVPGVELTGGVIKHTEKVITLDDLLVDDKAIANIDELMNHYDVRSIYANEMGAALARQFDKHVGQMGVMASRKLANIPGWEGHGNGVVIPSDYTGVVGGGDYSVDGEALAHAIFTAALVLEEKDIDPSTCYCFLRPAQFYKLVQNKDLMNTDWGGRGSYASAELPMVAGIPLVKTNNLPSTNITTGVAAGPDQGSGPKYAGNFGNTQALVMHPSAIGTLKLLDLTMEMDYSVRHQSTMLVAKYAVGHGILRPEAAVSIEEASKAALTSLVEHADVILD